MYAMMNISSVQNDDLSTFNLVGVEDIEIPENALGGIPKGFKMSEE